MLWAPRHNVNEEMDLRMKGVSIDLRTTLIRAPPPIYFLAMNQIRVSDSVFHRHADNIFSIFNY